MKSQTTRRDFLKQSAVAAAGVGLTPYLFSSVQPVRAQSPGDRLRMGCIGLGDMGRRDAAAFSELADVVAVCDVDSLHLNMARNNVKIGMKDADGKRIEPEGCKDYRKILDRKDIDVVSIMTVDHWHTKIAIEALQADKHVFCQKPLTLTIEENRLIRAACKKYDKTFQVGTQQRSQQDQFLIALLMMRKGILGDIKKLTCDIGTSPVCDPIPLAEVPDHLDYEMWSGQCPVFPYRATAERDRDGKADWPKASRAHYHFRWWYEYGGGRFTDWGAHHIDIALWALDQSGPGQGPVHFKPLMLEPPIPMKDGYPTADDRFSCVNKFHIECRLPNGVVMDVVSHSPDGNGILIEGTKGKVHVNRRRIKGKPYEEIGGRLDDQGRSKPLEQQPELQKLFTDEDFVKLYHGKKFEGHKANFIRCIREGGLPVSDVFTHVQTMNACHLCAISARLEREVAWDPKTETTGDAQSQTFLAREQRKGYEIPSVS